MSRKVVVVADPGIDGAFAVALGLLDADIDLLGLVATAGNVSAEQATNNVHILVEQMDPPRWPRIGAALPIEYSVDGADLHGPGGLGGLEFPCARLHHPHAGDKLICDLVRQYPGEVTVIVMGPCTVLARALDRDPEAVKLLHRVVVLGGTWREPGNAGPVTEFHFACDPQAARQIVNCGAPVTLIPLDAMRRVIFSPTDLLNLPAPESRVCQFLSKIAPYGIRRTASLYGIEGVHLKDILGIVAVTLPEAISVKPMIVDIETRGELTRGMTVIDARWGTSSRPNVDLVVNVDLAGVREYIWTTLGKRSGGSPGWSGGTGKG